MYLSKLKFNDEGNIYLFIYFYFQNGFNLQYLEGKKRPSLQAPRRSHPPGERIGIARTEMGRRKKYHKTARKNMAALKRLRKRSVKSVLVFDCY